MIKAIVTIKQEKITGKLVIIIAEVNIKGNKRIRQFSLDKNLNDTEKQKEISNKIREDYEFDKRNTSLHNFEVEL